MNLKDIILEKLQMNNFQAQIVSIIHIYNLKKEICKLYEQSLIYSRIYDIYLAEDHDFTLLDHFPEAKSLFIIAAPCHQTKIIFHYEDNEYTALLPSIIYKEEINRRKAERILKEVLENNGFEVRDAALPEKLIAVHSGLGLYGQNNLCYVSGMGSFLSLALFCSNFPSENDSWYELESLKSCKNCRVCLESCPTQAIDKERFLLYAEKCLAFYNENSGIFPDWLDPYSHTCLIGCLECQLKCPHNKSQISQFDDEVFFSQEETNHLLGGTPFDKLPMLLSDKIKKYGLKKYYVSLSRNLMAIIKRYRLKEKKTR
ncbi:MAG: hypothetical protein KGD57_06510 [Candidatus Lokiarchaeota archaeon]|nr:hypothetical protein [Candidatus Lokiarchaeota archaeon]